MCHQFIVYLHCMECGHKLKLDQATAPKACDEAKRMAEIPPLGQCQGGLQVGEQLNPVPAVDSNDAVISKEIIAKYNITAGGVELLTEIMNPGLRQSEDCLTLNIWTKPQAGERRKAVLVWVHGGSFVVGSSALPVYNGQFFADQEDVVLVSINYRLSIFGYPGNPLGAQNLGLLDQRLALEWVRDNIANFGGDPTRITLFGQSAGGVSADDHTYAWARNPIVHGVIAQSGTSTGIGTRTKSQAAGLWFKAASALGCGDQRSPAWRVQECMLRKPAADIAKATVATVNSPIKMPYCPTMDNIVVFEDNSQHVPAALPMLIGNTDFEGGLFELFTDSPVPPDFWRQDGQKMFVCPAARRAAVSVKDGNPTWRYRYHGVFPNMELSTNPPSGAYHEAEVPLLFDTVRQDKMASTREEVALGKYLRSAWAAFAKDPVHGLERLKWPRYNPNGTTLIRLGFDNKVGPNTAKGNMYDWGCE
ncbi:carboxylesterase [Purpureocillium lavendulum]|uniref:Carboxylic ester hydrolase n=1 Tax=Purpureocillium lavendulum TaxID=1247861 RepID=A0AB34FRC3_9HYPO|nr:carboxylesterase [Purpureocillium lavendulum]